MKKVEIRSVVVLYVRVVHDLLNLTRTNNHLTENGGSVHRTYIAGHAKTPNHGASL